MVRAVALLCGWKETRPGSAEDSARRVVRRPGLAGGGSECAKGVEKKLAWNPRSGAGGYGVSASRALSTSETPQCLKLLVRAIRFIKGFKPLQLSPCFKSASLIFFPRAG